MPEKLHEPGGTRTIMSMEFLKDERSFAVGPKICRMHKYVVACNRLANYISVIFRLVKFFTTGLASKFD